MLIFTDIEAAVDRLHSLIGDDVPASEMPGVLVEAGPDAAVRVLEEATCAIRLLESVRTAATGVVASASTREHGHSGAAQKRGHRNPVSLIQDITGASRGEASKAVRVGESLVSSVPAGGASGADRPDDAADAGKPVSPVRPWHAIADDALLDGGITTAQHDAIVRGLGVPTAGAVPVDDETDEADAVREAWAAACTRLVGEAPLRTVEEIARSARAIRDVLDPEGAAQRYQERFEGRSLRMYTDRDGVRRGSFACDDDGAAMFDAVLNAALRPRRGGPRFVDPDEKKAADDLAADTRTNEQLAYDLFVDVFTAGAMADAAQVFGTRQAGVRLVISDTALADHRGGSAEVGMREDDGSAVPAWRIDQHTCATGVTRCTVDHTGNPLDVGREQRLYTAKQRIALALRDGGCRWKNCDRPASYGEAHHIDEWAADKGETNIDRGILLCRYHHMALHNGGWKITRRGTDDFMLHPPGSGDDPIPLPRRTNLRYLWGDLALPPRRFRPGESSARTAEPAA